MDRGHLIVVLPFLVLFGRLCRSVLSCRSILLLLAFLALSYEGCCQGKIRIMMHTLSSSLCRCHVSPLSKSKWTPKRLVRIVLQGVYGLNSSGGLYCEKTIIDSFLLKVKKENCLNEKQSTLLVHTHLQFCNNLFNIWLTLDTYCIQTSTQKNLSIIQFLIVFFIFVCYLRKKMVLVLVTRWQKCHAATANTLKNSNSAFFLEDTQQKSLYSKLLLLGLSVVVHCHYYSSTITAAKLQILHRLHSNFDKVHLKAHRTLRQNRGNVIRHSLINLPSLILILMGYFSRKIDVKRRFLLLHRLLLSGVRVLVWSASEAVMPCWKRCRRRRCRSKKQTATQRTQHGHQYNSTREREEEGSSQITYSTRPF